MSENDFWRKGEMRKPRSTKDRKATAPRRDQVSRRRHRSSKWCRFRDISRAGYCPLQQEGLTGDSFRGCIVGSSSVSASTFTGGVGSPTARLLSRRCFAGSSRISWISFSLESFSGDEGFALFQGETGTFPLSFRC